MEGYSICQSCGMPLNPYENLGSEKDHSKSTIYCDSCYQEGEFTHPEMSIEDMKAHVRTEMQRQAFSEPDIVKASNRLQCLQRWMGIPILHNSCDYL